jgi:hypothetical protein
MLGLLPCLDEMANDLAHGRGRPKHCHDEPLTMQRIESQA